MGNGAPSPDVKQQRREDDHSSSYITEIKDDWSHTSTSPYTFTAWTEITLFDLVLSFNVS
jgi:hypothetical protein